MDEFTQLLLEQEKFIASNTKPCVKVVKSKAKPILSNLNARPSLLKPIVEKNVQSSANSIVPQVQQGFPSIPTLFKSSNTNSTTMDLSKICKEEELYDSLKLLDIEQFKRAEWMIAPENNEESNEIRFNFQGTQAKKDNNPNNGLYHHGKSPTTPGYTIDEIIHLSRSQFPGQRSIALCMLTQILSHRCRALWIIGHDYKPIEKIMLPTLPKSLGFVIRYSLDDKNNTVVANAIRTLHAYLVHCDELAESEQFFDFYCGMTICPPIVNVHPDIPTKGFSDIYSDIRGRSSLTRILSDEEMSVEEVFTNDSVAGMVRLEILPRVGSLLLSVREPVLIELLLETLLCISRHSIDISKKIVQTNSIIHALQTVLFQKFRRHVLQLARSLIQMCKTNVLCLSNIVQHALRDFEGSALAIQDEILRLMRVCIHFSLFLGESEALLLPICKIEFSRRRAVVYNCLYAMGKHAFNSKEIVSIALNDVKACSNVRENRDYMLLGSMLLFLSVHHDEVVSSGFSGALNSLWEIVNDLPVCLSSPQINFVIGLLSLTVKCSESIYSQADLSQLSRFLEYSKIATELDLPSKHRFTPMHVYGLPRLRIALYCIASQHGCTRPNEISQLISMILPGDEPLFHSLLPALFLDADIVSYFGALLTMESHATLFSLKATVLPCPLMYDWVYYYTFLEPSKNLCSNLRRKIMNRLLKCDSDVPISKRIFYLICSVLYIDDLHDIYDVYMDSFDHYFSIQPIFDIDSFLFYCEVHQLNNVVSKLTYNLMHLSYGNKLISSIVCLFLIKKADHLQLRKSIWDDLIQNRSCYLLHYGFASSELRDSLYNPVDTDPYLLDQYVKVLQQVKSNGFAYSLAFNSIQSYLLSSKNLSGYRKKLFKTLVLMGIPIVKDSNWLESAYQQHPDLSDSGIG